MYRAVFDTSILVAGLRSRHGASFALLHRIAEGSLKPLVTTALFLEYESVLKRPEHRLAHGFSEAELDRFLDVFASAGEGVDVNFYWRPQLSDPNDEMVFEAAINGRAEALITHNVRDFVGAARRFDLRILTPGELLKELTA